METIQLDLQQVYKSSEAIDDALTQLFDEVIKRRIKEAYILPSKGIGHLLKNINRHFRQPGIKQHFVRLQIEKNPVEAIRLFFRF